MSPGCWLIFLVSFAFPLSQICGRDSRAFYKPSAAWGSGLAQKSPPEADVWKDHTPHVAGRRSSDFRADQKGSDCISWSPLEEPTGSASTSSPSFREDGPTMEMCMRCTLSCHCSILPDVWSTLAASVLYRTLAGCVVGPGQWAAWQGPGAWQVPACQNWERSRTMDWQRHTEIAETTWPRQGQRQGKRSRAGQYSGGGTTGHPAASGEPKAPAQGPACPPHGAQAQSALGRHYRSGGQTAAWSAGLDAEAGTAEGLSAGGCQGAAGIAARPRSTCTGLFTNRDRQRKSWTGSRRPEASLWRNGQDT